jgi:hypothetical protein
MNGQYKEKTKRSTTEAPDEAEPFDALLEVHPEADGGRHSEQSGSLFLIIHSTAENGRKVYRCDGNKEAQTFLEMLIADGVGQDDLELFHASVVPFRLSYRAVVDFEGPADPARTE